ncbi:MAG TPA: alpha/beta hydrolase [Beijerinckiaceae bacterium]|nr:alpha/beta hydrolase [Beijerinckiaceae bacterium]
MRAFLVRLIGAAGALAAASGALAAAPPAQPKSGPGGSDYAGVQVVKRAIGRASAATYVFHLADTPAAPRPVVVFMHAWGQPNPQAYGGWIEHLARKGNLVLFPKYQEVNRVRPADASKVAASLVKDALATLAEDAQAKPDTDKGAYAGHLAGAAVALNLAATAKAEGLPAPKLVFVLMPGGIASDAKSRGVQLADLKELDASTLLVAMIGDKDASASDRASKRILREAENVPANRKLFVRTLSDDHGFPSLSATLFSPGAAKTAYDAAAIKLPPDPPRDPNAPRERSTWKWTADMALTGEQTVLANQLNAAATDALDYMGYWKALDMALPAAFSGKDATALRDNPAFVDMGRWSDGWPVKRLFAETPKTEPTKPSVTRRMSAPTLMPVPSKRRR